MSLVSQLMNGVTESSVDISGYDFTETASMESFYLDAACESLVSDIFNVDKAYHVADVVGEVQVIREGADPSLLLEGMVGDAISKLKEAFKKFLAKIKAWAAQVKKFFKVLFMKGKELAKTYGSEIRKKSTKGFKYKGYKYTIDKGNGIVETVSEGVKTEINSLCGDIDELKSKTGSELEDALKTKTSSTESSTSVFVIKSAKLGDIKSDMSTTDYQDRLISKLVSGASDVSELNENLKEAYRDGDTDKITIEDFEANDPGDMVNFLETFDKAVKDVETEERNFERDVNAVVKALDKISGMKDEKTVKLGDKETKFTTTYKVASKISGFISSALAVRKSVCDTKVAIYKEINSSWTSVLKSFVLKKEVKESAFFADFDSMIALTEAADVEPETPDPEDDGKEPAGEGCGKKACESLLEAAYNYI